VVHLLHTVAHGGIETILVNWLTRLDASRVEASVVVFANPGGTERAFLDAASAHGLRVRTIPWSRRKPVFSAARRLEAILRELDADIVHTHNVYAEIVGYLAARRVGAKVLTTQYVWADFGWKRNVQQWVSARLIRRFDLVTSQCAATMRETTRRGVPESRQRVLISGHEPCREFLTEAERAEARAREGVAPDHVVLLNLARLYPEKAQAFLLRAFRKIVDARPQARLWIMGVGPLEAELRALSAELGLDASARFVGFKPTPHRFLQLADVQVHPSFAEGVPLALCAGMAVGLPVVATAVGGVPEIVLPGRTGVLVEARDEAAFIAETIRMIDDVSERRRLGAGGRAFIETEYTLDVAASQLITTYEEMVR
jgi:glycosyltransferase involved in cell wall biosynthesis